MPAGSILSYSNAEGFNFKDPQGWTAAFGTSANDMALKIRVYQALVASLNQRGKTPSLSALSIPMVRIIE